MKKLFYIVLLMGFVFNVGCQADEIQPAPTEPVVIKPTPTAEKMPTTSPTPIVEITVADLQPFGVDLAAPLSNEVVLSTWEPQPYAGMDYQLPVDFWSTSNPEVIGGLTTSQQEFLKQNGFVVIHSQEESFIEIREDIHEYQGQPYFLSVDSALHALHLEFDEELKAIERSLNQDMEKIINTVLEQIIADRDVFTGSSIEADADQAIQYLYVALRLFNPDADVPVEFEQIVNQQVDLIMAAGGKGDSLIIADFTDDYGAYRPVGHYAGESELENYFRGMTWFGRAHFPLLPEDSPPSRAPLLITFALRTAQVDGQSAQESWGEMHELLTYLIGSSDDAGPLEYAAMMDEVYGTSQTALDLADDQLWAQFLDQADELPAPQINSTFVDWVSTDMEEEIGWRFMGQRFTLDGLIFQNLIFDMVKDKPDGSRRKFPTGLDVMAVFGSQQAYSTLEQLGEAEFPGYRDQFEILVASVEAQSEEQWLSRFYDGWLYSFMPILEAKDDAYPTFMQTEAWGFKDLNAALGSWAELKHDTVLYTKMPEGAGGGGPPISGPAPGYVEPNPEAFYRLSYITGQLYRGLKSRGYSGEGSFGYLYGTFDSLGQIAEKELNGEPLTEDDFNAIGGCLSPRDCYGTASPYNKTEPIEVPVIAAVSGAEVEVLEVGVGYIDRIYVVVPLNGTLQIAQGGVFSYYELIQPRSERLTDEEWRIMLREDPPDLPSWSDEFVFEGGSPVYQTAFRVGDIYIVTEAGDDLLWKETPSIDGKVIGTFYEEDYLQFVEGPVEADGYTWWKVRNAFDHGDGATEGWIAVKNEWLERSW